MLESVPTVTVSILTESGCGVLSHGMTHRQLTAEHGVSSATAVVFILAEPSAGEVMTKPSTSEVERHQIYSMSA